MDIAIVSLFPEFFSSVCSTALLGRAISKGILNVTYHNPREYAHGHRKNVDNIPYGGGVGMVLSIPELDACLSSIPEKGRILLLSASGKRFTQSYAKELAQEERLTLICGRYEGVDARICELYDIEEVSIGDFIVNGGEVGAVVILESVGRLLPSFMGKLESSEEESFSKGVLEYPHYTRPASYKGYDVPEVLCSGNHGEIARFRREKQLEKTIENRKDLLQNAILSREDRAYIEQIQYPRVSGNIYIGLVHYPVLGKNKKSIAVSLTNLDIHDIARCTCTYGLGGYYITTPIQAQQELCNTIVEHWREGLGAQHNKARSKAMECVYVVDTIEEAIESLRQSTGTAPFVIATSASAIPTLSYCDVRDIAKERVILILFGTSHGLAPEVYTLVDGILPPIRYVGGYNHLSVRSAVSITIDRILGDYF